MINQTKMSLVVPPDILENEDLAKLSRDERLNYIKKVILMILYKNRKRKPGIIATELKEILDYPSNTIDRAIHNLLQLRDIYSVQHKNRHFLYLNGKVVHKIMGNDIVLGNKRYIFKILANSRRKAHLFIQEKSIDFFGGEHNNGALMISLDNIDEFLEYLVETTKNAKDFFEKLREGKIKVKN